MPLTSPGNDDDTGENHQPTLRKNTAEPVEQTLKQNSMAELVDEWRAAHADGMRRVRDPETGEVVGMVGYGTVAEPDERTLMRLRLQAWADTRQAKGRWNTRVDYVAWNEELTARRRSRGHGPSGSAPTPCGGAPWRPSPRCGR